MDVVLYYTWALSGDWRTEKRSAHNLLEKASVQTPVKTAQRLLLCALPPCWLEGATSLRRRDERKPKSHRKDSDRKMLKTEPI